MFAKLSLDSSEYDAGLDDAKEKGSGIGSALKTAAKVGGAALAAAATAAGALAKSAVESYADYEQLVGGVETLFKTSADVVQKYAANAYKTAGLSANDYMETVTSFSASLLQSLKGDTQKAAEVSDMAITDMADNANKMGTAMESIQVAYQGFAKQNYTMLDNLKLGYGGTKSEMERLLADAEAFSGVHYDIENLNDVYEAIHVVQTELGITGTTAKEASETISGSLAATKSAWANLVTGISDENANFDELVSNFVESASTVGDNILPRISQALQGVGKLVTGLAPVIADAVPTLIQDVLPSLLESAVSLIGTVGKALIDNLPMLADSALQLVLFLATSLSENLPELIPSIVEIILQIVDTLTQPDTLSALVDASIAIIVALASGLIDALPRLIAKVPQIVENLVEAFINNAPKMLIAAAQLFAKLLEGIGQWMRPLLEKGREVVERIKDGFMQKVEDAKQWGKDLIQNFIDGIVQKWDALKDTVAGVAQTVKDFLGFSEPKLGPLSNFHTYAPDMMELFAKGIRDNEDVITDQIEKSFDFGTQTIDFASSTAGISSAATVNAMSSAMRGNAAGGGDLTLNLMLADGTVIARAFLKDFINVAAANGTPIATPVKV